MFLSLCVESTKWDKFLTHINIHGREEILFLNPIVIVVNLSIEHSNISVQNHHEWTERKHIDRGVCTICPFGLHI